MMFRALLAGALLVVCACADTGWVRLQDAHFEVYTNAGAGLGRHVLQRLEEVRAAISQASNIRDDRPGRLPVYVFLTEAEFRRFTAGLAARSADGFYSHTSDREYILMHTSPNTDRIVSHEYTHLLLHHSGAAAPSWLNEGTSEVYSTIETSKNRIRIGAAIASHLQKLRSSNWLTPAELLSLDVSSLEEKDRAKANLFYAQSWALIHMLMLDERYRARAPEFTRLVAAGIPQTAAFEQAFGKSVESALRDLRAYVRQDRLPEMLADGPAIAPSEHAEPTILTPLETELALADLLLSFSKYTEAEERYRTFARANPRDLLVVEEEWAALLLRRGYRQYARAHLRKAIELGSRNARTYFDYAAVMRDEYGEVEEAAATLRKAIELDPDNVAMLGLLGAMLADSGRPAEAVVPLRALAKLAPTHPNVWCNLAMAYFRAGQYRDALAAAEQARASAKTPEDVSLAAATLNLVRTEDSRLAEIDQPNVREIVPKSWENRKGDQRVEGRLVQLDCLGKAARFHILRGAERIALYVEDPSRVVITNTPGSNVQLGCGPLPARDVTVDYVRKPDAKLKTAGEITAIQFK